MLVYLYDEAGAPIGLQYRNDTYGVEEFDSFFFEKNLQGDIVAIYNENGVKIGQYQYDAWGNHSGKTLTTNTLERKIVYNYNPFRYRGYYYDLETGFYYLQSRYYNPEWCRWINADSQLNTSLGVLGLNVFAYCLNDPVNKVDHGGNKPGDLFDTADDAARDFAFYINGQSIEKNREYASYVYEVTTWERRTVTIVNPNIFGDNIFSELWNQIFRGGATRTKTIKVRVTKYTYRKPLRGTSDSSMPRINWFGIHKKVARLHTHAAYDPEYGDGNDLFSQKDIQNAIKYNMPTYVATPFGTLRKYDPKTGLDIVLYDDIPYDPNHPMR